MNKRGTGVAFCGIAAFLYAAYYLSAAIFMSGVCTWSNELFMAGIEYVGSALPNCAKLSLVVGVVYLLWAEIENIKTLAVKIKNSSLNKD